MCGKTTSHSWGNAMANRGQLLLTIHVSTCRYSLLRPDGGLAYESPDLVILVLACMCKRGLNAEFGNYYAKPPSGRIRHPTVTDCTYMYLINIGCLFAITLRSDWPVGFCLTPILADLVDLEGYCCIVGSLLLGEPHPKPCRYLTCSKNSKMPSPYVPTYIVPLIRNTPRG